MNEIHDQLEAERRQRDARDLHYAVILFLLRNSMPELMRAVAAAIEHHDAAPQRPEWDGGAE